MADSIFARRVCFPARSKITPEFVQLAFDLT